MSQETGIESSFSRIKLSDEITESEYKLYYPYCMTKKLFPGEFPAVQYSTVYSIIAMSWPHSNVSHKQSSLPTL